MRPLSFSNVTGTTVDLSWTLPAQPELLVFRVEVHYTDDPAWPGHGRVELAGDATSTWMTIVHGGVTRHFRVRLVTNAGEVDWVRLFCVDGPTMSASGMTRPT